MTRACVKQPATALDGLFLSEFILTSHNFPAVFISEHTSNGCLLYSACLLTT